MNRRVPLLRIATAVVLFIFAWSAMAVAGLPYPQREALRRAEWSLSDIEKKLSKGVNAEEAGYMLKTVASIEERMAKQNFPKGNQRVEQFMARLKAVKSKLQTIAGAAAAPAPPEAASPPKPAGHAASASGSAAKASPSASAATKLPYRAREVLRRLEGSMKRLEQELAKAQDIVEGSKVLRSYPDVNAQGTLESMERELEKNNVPAGHPRVKALRERMEKAKALDAHLRQEAAPKIAAFEKQTDPGNYPEFQNDIERLKSWAKAYSSAQFGGDEKDAENTIKLWKQFNQVVNYVNSRTKEYAPLLEQNTSASKRYEVYHKQLAKWISIFAAKRERFIQSAPSIISSNVNKARKMTVTAQKRRSPLFFDGGIKQSLDKAKVALKLFEGLQGPDDPKVKEAKALVAAAVSEAKAAKKALEKEILATNRPPKDQYTGGDRGALIAKVKEAWKKNNPSDEIIKILIPYKTWRREKGWSWNGADNRWEKYDRQYLQLAVVVKSDDEIATIYPAFINRDNKTTYEIRKVLLKNL